MLQIDRYMDHNMLNHFSYRNLGVYFLQKIIILTLYLWFFLQDLEMLAKSMHVFTVLHADVRLISRSKLTTTHSSVSTSISLCLKRQQHNSFYCLCSFLKYILWFYIADKIKQGSIFIILLIFLIFTFLWIIWSFHMFKV